MYEEDSENKIDKRTEIMDDVDEHEGECRQQSSHDAQDVNWTTPNRTLSLIHIYRGCDQH